MSLKENLNTQESGATPSLHHSFDINLAAIYGVHEAIIIHHFQHWIRVNKTLKRNFKDGRTWTYQTFEEIAAHFPYLNAEQVRYLIERLCTGKSKGKRAKKEFEPVLIKANFNRSKFDRTTWYALVNEPGNSNNSYERENSQMDKGKFPNGNGDIHTPIPDTKTYTKTSSSSPTPPSKPKPDPKKSAPLEEEEPSPEEKEELIRRYAESCSYAESKGNRAPIKNKKWMAATLKSIRESAINGTGSTIEENMRIAKDLVEKMQHKRSNAEFESCPDYLQITSRGHAFILPYGDKDFKLKLQKQLEKMGIKHGNT